MKHCWKIIHFFADYEQNCLRNNSVLKQLSVKESCIFTVGTQVNFHGKQMET